MRIIATSCSGGGNPVRKQSFFDCVLQKKDSIKSNEDKNSQLNALRLSFLLPPPHFFFLRLSLPNVHTRGSGSVTSARGLASSCGGTISYGPSPAFALVTSEFNFSIRSASFRQVRSSTAIQSLTSLN